MKMTKIKKNIIDLNQYYKRWWQYSELLARSADTEKTYFCKAKGAEDRSTLAVSTRQWAQDANHNNDFKSIFNMTGNLWYIFFLKTIQVGITSQKFYWGIFPMPCGFKILKNILKVFLKWWLYKEKVITWTRAYADLGLCMYYNCFIIVDNFLTKICPKDC